MCSARDARTVAARAWHSILAGGSPIVERQRAPGRDHRRRDVRRCAAPGGTLPMKSSSQATPRRKGVTAVHSLDRFVFTVPDLNEAQRFYSEFGLEARREGQRLDLHTHGPPQHWGSIDRKSTRLNSSHRCISYAVFCLKKKK